MKSRQQRMAGVCIAMLAALVAMLSLAGSASAKLVGNFTRFEQCPYTNETVFRCIHSINNGGEVVMGSKKVPIVNPVVLQGGFMKPVEKISTFVEAKNGVTLQKVGQPVPGGLAGLVNCPEITNFLLRISCEAVFENGLTGVNSILELARPANEIRISETNLTRKEGVALKLPVRVRLENPFLGSNCYVGSSSSPIYWELTSGTTNPPEPNTPITGSAGKIEFLEEGRILVLNGNTILDNAWAAPKTSGCGGIFSFLLDPIVSASSGLPSAAGTNTAILKNTVSTATRIAVLNNDLNNP